MENMNVVQNIIERQLGIYSLFNYDSVLKRLVVSSQESFYGLESGPLPDSFSHDSPIFACRFAEVSGYEHILALASEDGRVAIQNTSTANSAASLVSFHCHNNAVFDLAWQPYHRSFVTVSGDHTACLWDVSDSSPRSVLTFSNHTKSVKTVAFRPVDPSVFGTGARDGHVLVWDIRAHNQTIFVHKPDNCLTSCHSSFTPKTPGSHGKRPRLDTQRAISVTGLVFQNDLTLISCGECDGNIKVWDLRKNYSVYKKEPLPKHSIPYCGSSAKNGYANLVMDEARVRLYASCMDDVVYCFNVAAYGSLPERRYVGHENGTFYIKTGLSPDDAYLVSGSSDKNAYIWNVKCSYPVAKLTGHRAEVTCAAWCRRGDPKLVTCSDDARHKIWRIGPEVLDGDAEPAGRAEPVPRADAACLPQWGGSGRTPTSLKRKLVQSTPGSYSAKRACTDARGARRTKRCLADLMNASKEAHDIGATGDRPAPDLPSIPEERRSPAAVKRPRLSVEPSEDYSTPRKHSDPDPGCNTTPEWTYYNPKPGTSFMSPTKNYEKRSGRVLAPVQRSPRASSAAPPRTPVKVSPTKIRVLSFTTPTKNLPNFVLDGEAPHLRLMSPVRKKQDTTDWLTLMVRERKGRAVDTVDRIHQTTPLSPKEALPARGLPVARRARRSLTLLQYFSVVPNKKSEL